MEFSLRPPQGRLVGPDGSHLPSWEQWFGAIFRAQRVPRTFSFDPATVGAGSTSAQTVAIERLTTDMDVLVTKPTHTPGIVIGGAFVPAAGQLTIILGNVTGAAIDPPAETWRLLAWRR